jgi:hypothetical protein
MTSLREQIRNNLLAIISLVVAFSALGYNTWRNELTERNRNIRVAGIELISEIGSLQQIIFYARYAEGDPRGELRMGWADMLTIKDLAALMPVEVGRDAENLGSVWEANSAGLIEAETNSAERLDRDEAFRRIDAAIDQLRQTTLAGLRKLR